MFLRLLAAALLCVLMTHAVDARPRHGHHHRNHSVVLNIARAGCSDWFVGVCVGGARNDRHFRFERKYPNRIRLLSTGIGGARRAMPHGLYRVMADGAGRVVGGRPRGCPRRYCGCGASLHVFGRIIPSLNLAANWLRFPRSAPAPGMVAARRGHVFVLERHMRGNVWWVYDANSGRHRTRVHPRSIAGFRIVNPHASRLALQ